ncbi:hypothetical protein C8R44DRAFT_741855 [Mycena epipterygia]|nr:hypothetical protein C8R44DRAFT_741855 [Mycena epipterygia]
MTTRSERGVERWGSVRDPEVTDRGAGSPEHRTQSRDKRDLSELGSTEVESGTLQKVAEGDMRVKSKRESGAESGAREYPGISGWTYTHQDGFSTTDEIMAAWASFANAHRHFKPFVNEGWPHFDKVHEILPTRAKGKYVFNAAHVPASVGTWQKQADPDENDVDGTQTQSTGTAFLHESQLSQSTDTSQPLIDWEQSQSQPQSQLYDLDDDHNNLLH